MSKAAWEDNTISNVDNIDGLESSLIKIEVGEKIKGLNKLKINWAKIKAKYEGFKDDPGQGNCLDWPHGNTL